MAMRPSFIVDISETFEAKMQAILSYRSQFHNAAETGETPNPVQTMIGARYGEPFVLREPLEIRDPVDFFTISRIQNKHTSFLRDEWKAKLKCTIVQRQQLMTHSDCYSNYEKR